MKTLIERLRAEIDYKLGMLGLLQRSVFVLAEMRSIAAERPGHSVNHMFLDAANDLETRIENYYENWLRSKEQPKSE